MMALLLTVDTSSELCSVALAGTGSLMEDTRKVDRKHNEALLGMLDGLFRRAGVAATEVDGIAFNAGPGSFTGGRIACSAAQAIGYAADARLLPVRSSELLAEHAFSNGAQQVCTSVRSRGVLYYLAEYDARDGCVSTDLLCEAPPSWWRDGASLAGAVPPWLPASYQPVEADPSPASTMVSIADRAWVAGRFVAPEQALPVYVSGDDPWRGA